MSKRQTLSAFLSLAGIGLSLIFGGAPACAQAQQPSKQEQQEQSAQKDEQKDEQAANTIWLEEKLNPGTQWLEQTVKPLTRWLEQQVQAKPKPQPSNKRPSEISSKPEPSTSKLADSDKPLSRAQIRQLLEQRYQAEILHIKALGQAEQMRYRVKLINPQGVVKILYLSAIDGSEIRR
ncbi:MAG: hypothetical protein OIF35_07720 [Cellvibrionaceae bacterium]|nr:hypothetical protein [Cellvibrionaceae bacterium]MCV6626994.1 hypothetical protein [Cellvibrionaceae bacterium]